MVPCQSQGGWESGNLGQGKEQVPRGVELQNFGCFGSWSDSRLSPEKSYLDSPERRVLHPPPHLEGLGVNTGTRPR